MVRRGKRLGGAEKVYWRALLGAIAILVWGVASAGIAEAKTPGKTYCFNGICHRVKTISETQRLVGVRTVLHASHYDSCKKDRFNPCGLTSSGEEFRPWKSDNAASPLYPDGTKLLVWHPGSKKAAVVRINNAGPYYGKRTLDLSRATAEKLGFGKGGVSTVHAKVIAAPSPSEATYKRNRTYASVPGYIGFFDTIDKALTSLGQAVAGLFGAPAQAASRPPAIARTRIATTTKANGAKSNGDRKPSGAANRTTSANSKKPKSAAAKSLAHG